MDFHHLGLPLTHSRRSVNVCGWMSLDTGVLASQMGGAWLEALPFGARTGHGDDGAGIPPPRPITKNPRRQSVVTSTQSWEKNRAPGAGGLIPARTPKAMAPGFPGPMVDIPPWPPATGTLGRCLLSAPPMAELHPQPWILVLGQ